MARLKEICTINMGQSPSSSSYNDKKEGLPFFQGNADFGDISPTVRIWCNAPTKIASEGDILISVRAPIGALNIADRQCCIGRGLAALTVNKEKCSRRYLWHALNSKTEELNSKGTGSTFKAISKKVLEETEIHLPQLDEQTNIIHKLDNIDRLLGLRKQQILRLDQIVKSRFVEMFGDPISNSFDLPTLAMTEVCYIIDGDRGIHYPKQEDFSNDGYCLFLNTKNVTYTGFNFNSCAFITKQKDSQLRKGKLQYGDIVLTTRGTIGNLAYYTKNIPFENVRINSGMVILRMKSLMSELFFIEQFKMRLFDIKEKIASGSAQPQLPISTMNKISILVPPLTLQEQFATFVQQVDKSKFLCQFTLKRFTDILFAQRRHLYG